MIAGPFFKRPRTVEAAELIVDVDHRRYIVPVYF